MTPRDYPQLGSADAPPANALPLLSRLGPIGIAAIVAGVLALFGIGAIAIPVLLTGAPTPPAGAAPAVPAGELAVPGSTAPTSEPSASPTAPPSATPSPTRTAARPTPATAGDPRLEEQALAQINNERRRARCAPLRMDQRLRASARAHSLDMATRGSAGTTGRDGSSPADRMRAAGYPQPLTESVAAGPDSGRDVVRGWLRDRGERADILNCDAKAAGVGVAYRGRTPYWTLDLGR